MSAKYPMPVNMAGTAPTLVNLVLSKNAQIPLQNRAGKEFGDKPPGQFLQNNFFPIISLSHKSQEEGKKRDGS